MPAGLHFIDSPQHQTRDRAAAIIDAVLELRRDDVTDLIEPQRLRHERELSRALRLMVQASELANSNR